MAEAESRSLRVPLSWTLILPNYLRTTNSWTPTPQRHSEENLDMNRKARWGITEEMNLLSWSRSWYLVASNLLNSSPSGLVHTSMAHEVARNCVAMGVGYNNKTFTTSYYFFQPSLTCFGSYSLTVHSFLIVERAKKKNIFCICKLSTQNR